MPEETVNISEVLPAPPSFNEEQIKACKEKGDFRSILFEWYKFVGQLVTVVAAIQRDSEACNPIPARHYHVLVGLLNRCARLMLANVALSHEGRFGETTAIIDRCIFESAVKIAWLSTNSTQQKFDQYIADGLKPEIEFKNIIQKNSTKRGRTVPIEQRMLDSIKKCISTSGLTEQSIGQSQKLLDLASMLRDISMDRTMYVAAQRMGSHHIHGTWPSLLFHYLEESKDDPQDLVPSGHNSSTHINQFIFVSTMVLLASKAHARYALKDPEAEQFTKLFDSTLEEIESYYSEIIGDDFK